MAERSQRQTREVGEKAAVDLDNKATVLIQWKSSNNVSRLYVTGFHITRLPHTQNQTYDFTRNGLLV